MCLRQLDDCALILHLPQIHTTYDYERRYTHIHFGCPTRVPEEGSATQCDSPASRNALLLEARNGNDSHILPNAGVAERQQRVGIPGIVLQKRHNRHAPVRITKQPHLPSLRPPVCVHVYVSVRIRVRVCRYPCLPLFFHTWQWHDRTAVA